MITTKFKEVISSFSRALLRVYFFNSQFAGDLTNYISKINKWIRRFHIMRFISLQLPIAITWFRRPKVEEEFIINFKLLKDEWTRGLPQAANISKILSDFRSGSEEASRLLYKKIPLPQWVASFTKMPKLSSTQRVYAVYPRAASAMLYKYTSIMQLMASIYSVGSPKIPFSTLQKLYETRALEAVPLKFFGEKKTWYRFKVFRALSRAYEEGMESSMRKILETSTGETQPTLEEIGEIFRPIIQRSYPKFTRAYVLTRMRKGALLPTHEAYIKRMFYTQAPSFKLNFFMDVEKNFDLLAQKTWRSELYTLSRTIIENLLWKLPDLSWEKILKTSETDRLFISQVYTYVFFDGFIYPFTRQLLSPKVEYFSPVAKFFKSPLTPLSILPLTEQRIISLVSKGLGGGAVGFKVIRHYTEVAGETLPHLVDYHPTARYFMPRSKFMAPHLMKLRDYSGLMGKSLDTVYPLISGVKTVFGSILLKSDSRRLIKSISEILSTYVHSAIGKPLIEVSYSGWDTSFQLLRIRDMESFLQLFSSALPSSSETLRVQHPINITVRVESPADEGDLRDLERKIVKILREEARRHGLNI